MKPHSTILSLIGLAALAACASSSHIVTGKVRSALKPNQVLVYTVAPAGSEQIAILTVDSAGMTAQGEKDIAIAKLKREAASLGANGVLLQAVGEGTSGVVGNFNAQSGTLWAGQSTFTIVHALAIYVDGQK